MAFEPLDICDHQFILVLELLCGNSLRNFALEILFQSALNFGPTKCTLKKDQSALRVYIKITFIFVKTICLWHWNCLLNFSCFYMKQDMWDRLSIMSYLSDFLGLYFGYIYYYIWQQSCQQFKTL